MSRVLLRPLNESFCCIYMVSVVRLNLLQNICMQQHLSTREKTIRMRKTVLNVHFLHSYTRISILFACSHSDLNTSTKWFRVIDTIYVLLIASHLLLLYTYIDNSNDIGGNSTDTSNKYFGKKLQYFATQILIHSFIEMDPLH